jgi:hypothetical protein
VSSGKDLFEYKDECGEVKKVEESFVQSVVGKALVDAEQRRAASSDRRSWRGLSRNPNAY